MNTRVSPSCMAIVGITAAFVLSVWAGEGYAEQACTIHYDCPQGYFCYYGTCIYDPTAPVYHCGKSGCPPGRWCIDQALSKSTCAEDTTYVCETACDCGPAHACLEISGVGKRCVKDVNDPFFPGGTAIFNATIPAGEPTYCCAASECFAVRAARTSSTLADFVCYDRYYGTSSNFCGEKPCFFAGDCAPGQSCPDVYSDKTHPGAFCTTKGGRCTSNAIAEVLLGYNSSDFFPACSTLSGGNCEAGWKPGGAYVARRVIGKADSCGNAICEAWETHRTCSQDCKYCLLQGPDGRCEPEEYIFGDCPQDCGTCGDGICNGLETPKTCPADCAVVCGDGSCDASEVTTCPQDCGCAVSPALLDYPSFCGDGRCDPALASLENCGTCPTDCGACAQPVVTKDAHTSFKRTYHWSISKTADQAALTLALNQSFLVNYAVSADASYTDSNWAVTGAISISNPSTGPTVINNVLDDVSGVGAAAVTCGVTFPYSLAGQATLTCAYSANLPDATNRTNTLRVLIPSASGVISVSATAAINFASATLLEIDKCASLTDSLYGPLGTVCEPVGPTTLSYSLAIGPYTSYGSYATKNTVTLDPLDTHAIVTANWTVAINVPYPGCTLTTGYWKSHAGFGAQLDLVTKLLPSWLGTPGGAKSIQVTTAEQALTLLSKSDDASNGINKLYAQLLAAKFNIADGADGSAVAGTISAADAFLATQNSADWSNLTKAQKVQVLSWMTTLDNYNTGLIGPGHCSQ